MVPGAGHATGRVGREAAITRREQVAARRGNGVTVHSDDLLRRTIGMYAEGVEVPCLGVGAGHTYP